MTGSTLVLIVVPIVMLVALGAWLALVYYAGEHPEWKAHRLAREAAAAAALAGDEAATAPDEDEAMPVPGGDRKPVVSAHAA